jgi:hypothetical protein
VSNTRDYTDQQQEQFRRTLARRRRNTITAMIVMIPSGVIVGLWIAAGPERFAILGIPPGVWGPLALVFLVGSVVAAALNWRCPACGVGLPIYANPRRCEVCGAELQ